MAPFFCTECGAETLKWSGKCPACGAWNSLRETSRLIKSKSGRNDILSLTKSNDIEMRPLLIKDIIIGNQSRILSNIGEFDGTLGGGIVPGMVVLIGGEPGVGKSTLMLQVANNIAKFNIKVLYISGEESKEQIKLRSDRLSCEASNLYLFCTTNVEDIIRSIEEFEPNLIIIDSIQSVYTKSLDNVPGSISQLRECTSIFTRVAKQKNISFFLIGHVTKDGVVAGPKIIEHMVDTVLYFEGEVQNQYKILRATKNRFGSTNEIGIFEMHNDGLKEVLNPSQMFLNQEEGDIGTAIGCVLEGTRAFLVEVQALVSSPNYGTSQRVALGFDHKKLALLLAVVEKKLSLNLRQNDVFINLAGGIKVLEPSLDLAIVASLLSSYKEIPLPPNTLLLGEVGLNGKVRPVSQTAKRIKEGRKLGYKNIIISNKTKNIRKDLHIKRIDQIAQLLPILISSSFIR